MLQLPVIVVLMISMFVGSVSPVQQQEGHDSKVDMVHLKEATVNLNNDSSKADKPPVKTVNDTKESINATNNSALLKNSSSVDGSPVKGDKEIKNEKQNCNAMKEQDDMLGCHVTPTDDDGPTEQDTTLNSTDPTINTTVATNNKTEATTESPVPNVPAHKDEEENGGKNMEISLNNTQTTNQVSYDVVSAETNHTVDTNNSDSSMNSKHDLNGNEASVNAVPPLDDKVEGNMGSENIGAIKSADQIDNSNNHMPSGIIALVTAISFAVAIALVYIGMIVWRRYIEYRYGHRELLVNELEFDTNDLRHFEL